MNSALARLMVIGALQIAPLVLAAQKPTPAVLNGTVRDADGRPIPDVMVDISPGRRHFTTDTRGHFHVDKLPLDSLVMIVRRVGLVPQTYDMNLMAGQNEMNITMEQVPQVLDAVRNQTEQTGLFGVVGDTAFDLVPGALVSTVVRQATTGTNEKGQFFFDPVSPGADMVDVRKLGFRPRMVSFTIPPKGGQRLAIWLTPLPSGLDERALKRLSAPSFAIQHELFNFGMRRRWASSGQSMFAPRDVLSKYANNKQADEALRFLPRFNGVHAEDIDCVMVDGTWAGGTVDRYTTNEMESLEIAVTGLLSTTEQERCAWNSNGRGGYRSHWVAIIMLRH